MRRRPSPKAHSTAIPSRAEVAAALAFAGLVTTSSALGAAEPPPATSASVTLADAGDASAGNATLVIEAIPADVTVTVDGVPVSAEEARRLSVLPRPHTVVFRSACGHEVTQKIEVGVGMTFVLEAPPIRPEGPGERLGGVPHDDYRVHKGCCGSGPETAQRGRGPGSVALVALALAALGARRRRRPKS
jgi:MYXO-CTERM domain-containing protein